MNRVLKETDGGQASEDVLTSIQFGNMQLWDVLQGRAVCVTEIQAYPRYSQLLVYLVAGADAADWIAKGDAQLTSFAKSQHCKYIVFQGRPGWERYCGRLGYTDKLIMMRKGV